MPAQRNTQLTFDARYVQSLILDKSNIQHKDYATGLDLLRNYSKIPEAEIPTHVADIQRRAYTLAPYPCIGLLRFLICSLSEHPLYPTVLTRLSSPTNPANPATFLDIGACFGQDIRKLAHDGAPTGNCTAVDLEPGFFSLADELFRDTNRLDATFVDADIFAPAGGPGGEVWRNLEGAVDIVHASSFFHLFGLEKQKVIASRICRLLRRKEGGLVLGLQLAAKGRAEHVPVLSEEEMSFCHDVESLRGLWEEAGRETGLLGGDGGLRWEVELVDRDMPESHRVGLLADERLREVLWSATLVGG